MDERSKLRRLAKLGIQGHQPAVTAFCKMTKKEKEVITGSLLKQKVGSNPKSTKAYNEFAERRRKQEEGSAEEGLGQGPSEKIRVRLARIAVGTTVRWKRARKEGAPEEEKGKEQRQDQRMNYTTRILTCTRCEAPQETKWMQLRTVEGYMGHPLQGACEAGVMLP